MARADETFTPGGTDTSVYAGGAGGANWEGGCGGEMEVGRGLGGKAIVSSWIAMLNWEGGVFVLKMGAMVVGRLVGGRRGMILGSLWH